jgi:hypothetical protein
MERVGVRGPLHGLRLAEAPPHPSLRVDLSPQAGRGKEPAARPLATCAKAVALLLFACSLTPAHAQTTVEDFYKNRQINLIVGYGPGGGNDITAPPGVPADRAKALQDAFLAAHRDPGFLGEAARLGIDISPLGAPAMQGGIEQLSRSSPATFDYMKKLLAAEK